MVARGVGKDWGAWCRVRKASTSVWGIRHSRENRNAAGNSPRSASSRTVARERPSFLATSPVLWTSSEALGMAVSIIDISVIVKVLLDK